VEVHSGPVPVSGVCYRSLPKFSQLFSGAQSTYSPNSRKSTNNFGVILLTDRQTDTGQNITPSTCGGGNYNIHPTCDYDSISTGTALERNASHFYVLSLDDQRSD